MLIISVDTKLRFLNCFQNQKINCFWLKRPWNRIWRRRCWWWWWWRGWWRRWTYRWYSYILDSFASHHSTLCSTRNKYFDGTSWSQLPVLWGESTELWSINSPFSDYRYRQYVTYCMYHLKDRMSFYRNDYCSVQNSYFTLTPGSQSIQFHLFDVQYGVGIHEP